MCPTAQEAQSQVQHFNGVDTFQVFRLPVPWQSLVNNDLVTNQLDSDFMDNTYDPIVQACLTSGAYCIIDIHNYARWYGQIVGQGGPEDNTLATTWSQLASRYQNETQVIFGIMNEPHDLDIGVWATTLQASVTAIRDAGAQEQLIFLAGTDFANAGAFPTNSGPYLGNITNPDGSTSNLIFEVHQYFDSDTSGTHAECSQPQNGTFDSLASYLRSSGRKAFVGELGGGNGSDCVDLIGAALDVIIGNQDVYIGWTSWAAGTFPSSYVLNEVPNEDGSDQTLVQDALVPKWKAAMSQ